MNMLQLAKGEFGRPKVQLQRDQWLRLVVVGVFAVLSLARVVPDAVRLVYPLSFFGYATDGDGVVVSAPRKPHKGSDAILVGDRVRIDRIKPFDRKPGLARVAFTYDNPDRHLPVDRDGRVLRLHLVGQSEPVVVRWTALFRILIYVASIFLGGILYLIKPRLPTAAFFIFCLGGDYPTTYADLWLPVPWRELPTFIGDALRGAAVPALLLFAFCLLEPAHLRRRVAAFAAFALALFLGTLHAYGNWLLTYGGRPAQRYDTFYADSTTVLTMLALLLFALTFARAKGDERTRAALILSGFAIAGLGRIASLELYPAHMGPWVNAALQTAPIVPIVIVWIAVVRHSFFNVDFFVSRGIVFVALTGAFVGFVVIVEEFSAYLFYNNVDVAYVVSYGVAIGLGMIMRPVRELLERVVDRFVFRDRHNQRLALELISGYILDAESAEDVFRALLQDATHALQLSFAGILTRRPNGDYVLTQSYGWPPDLDVRLSRDDDLTHEIVRSRGVMTRFSAKQSGLIRRAFPTGLLTFAAPLFAEHRVGAIVVYGHNVSGLDLDPDERGLLVRVVEHASIALREIELARLRTTVDRLTHAVQGVSVAE